MDSLPSGTRQSNDADTVMEENESIPRQNGFINPGVLLPKDDQVESDQMDQSEQYSAYGSQTSLIDAANAIPRAHWLPTGCCYDDRMKLHANADFSANPAHPEDPRRIEAIMREFKEGGLIYTGGQQELLQILKDSPTRFMWRIAARKATKEEICLAHTVGHFDWVQQLGMMSSAELRSLTAEFDKGRKSLYVGSLTYEAALISAGGAIETCKNIVAGQVKNAIAIIRPPGHHAEHNESMGFCIFNNVPIAAKVCMADYPETCRRVLILDWDVHHGNGIQNMFYSDANVLYISIHVYKNGTFYPGEPEEEGAPDGGLESCGVGNGEGMNVNIGWHDQGMGDAEYMSAFQNIVMPIAREFDPDLVIVSAGFDAAAGDDLGGCAVSPACYSHMTHMLMSLADGKVAVCLEGGYNLKAISRSALAVAKTLMGEPPQRITVQKINYEASQTIANVQRIQAKYWQCLRPAYADITDLKSRENVKASVVIRTAEKAVLAEKHNMIPLYVQREKLSRSFDDQVLATPELWNAKKIMLIMHDPPEMIAGLDPGTNVVHPHHSFVTSGVLPYIDWAIGNGYGVIDVNFPQFYSTKEDPYSGISGDEVLQQQTRELLCYVWDNYLELNTAASVTLVGIGDAYMGIKQLLVERNIKNRVPSVLAFVPGSIRPVKSDTDPYLSGWYQKHSRLYVAHSHSCFTDPDTARRIHKSRYGTVEKSSVEGVGRMLAKYLGAAMRWVTEMDEIWMERNRDEESGSGDELGMDE